VVSARPAAAAALLVVAMGAGRAPATDLRADYGEATQRLITTAREQGQAFAMLQHLTDRIGPRLAGSEGAAEAVRWTRQHLGDMGLRAWTEPVRVPHWVRGEETGAVVAPAKHRLVLTALGGSAPTPPEGLTAEVVEVDSLEALAALPDAAVKGRIVLFNRAMSTAADYGRFSPLRTRGPALAARRGAVGALVRSLGTLSARLPHTGATNFASGDTPIPAAAVTSEDAELLHRLLAGGEAVRVRLSLSCRTLGEADSANVLAEVRGRELPDEIVLIGAHLDSWDLGTGAHDDGAGVVMVMETLRLLKTLGLTPRRTVRGVLFMNEENGLRGARAYAEAHAAELPRHVLAMETDSGAGRPTGVSALVGPGGLERVKELMSLVQTVGGTNVQEGGGGADLLPLLPAGVPQLGLRHDTREYFHWHHTAADTLDKVDPAQLAEGAATLAVLAYAAAELPQPLPRPAPVPAPTQ
jgi:hypothetical protein